MSAKSHAQPLTDTRQGEKTVLVWGATHAALGAMQARERERRGARKGPSFAELIARAVQDLEQKGI